jgi:hypothetical protein
MQSCFEIDKIRVFRLTDASPFANVGRQTALYAMSGWGARRGLRAKPELCPFIS